MAVMVYGKMMSKEDFFDYVSKIEFEADYALTDELEQRYTAEYRVLIGIIRAMGWQMDYWKYREQGYF